MFRNITLLYINTGGRREVRRQETGSDLRDMSRFKEKIHPKVRKKYRN